MARKKPQPPKPPGPPDLSHLSPYERELVRVLADLLVKQCSVPVPTEPRS